jgi:hypothetical protein
MKLFLKKFSGKFKPKRSILKLNIVVSCLIFFLISVSTYYVIQNYKSSLNKQDKLSSNKVTEYVTKIKSLCENRSDWRYCYGNELGKINKEIKFSQTIQILRALEKSDPKTADCHLIAHKISSSEVEKDPQKWIDIFDYVDQTTCTNAFVHGVIEGRSRFDSTLVLDENTIPQICNQIQQKTANRVGKVRESADDACAHIMGHIILADQDAIIEKAVQVCAKVPQNIKRPCFDGVFMENITRDNLEIHEIAKKFALTKSAALGLEQTCKQYSGEQGLSCWRELAHIYTVLSQNKPLPTYNLCYQTDNEEYAKECYMHSINLMVLSDNYSLYDLKDTCSPYHKQEKTTEYCLSRTITPLLGSSYEFMGRAVSLCESQPDMSRKFCYSNIGNMIKQKASLNQRKNLCKKVPEKYFKNCIGEN